MEATELLTRQPRGAVAALRDWFERLCDLDFTTPVAFAALAGAYLASRLVFLDFGYGTDPDAWRVALTGEYLLREGDYYPSRLPGYPLHEFVTTATMWTGSFLDNPWVLTNLTTVAVSLAGVYLFAMLARKLDLPNAGLLTLGFAFAPLLWINSVMTMDYMWALTFLLAAYLAILYRSPTAAGLALGVAAGFRLTSLFMLPVFWVLLVRTGSREHLRTVTFTALAITLGAYTLALMDYGLNVLNFYDEPVQYQEFIKRLGKDGLGIVGGLALIVALALSAKRLRRFPADLVRDPQVLTWAATIAIFFVSYMRLPHEIAYLIPLFPFGYFLMARYMSRAVLAMALAVIVLAGFVDITSPDDKIGITSETFTSSRIGRGMMLSNFETLRNQRDFADELRELTVTNEQIERPAVIVVGFIYPQLVMRYQDELRIGLLHEDLEAISQLSDKGLARDETNQLEYVWLLDFDDFQAFQDEGKSIYYTADAATSNLAVYGYRLGYFGGLELPLSRDNPSLGEGTADTDR